MRTSTTIVAAAVALAFGCRGQSAVVTPPESESQAVTQATAEGQGVAAKPAQDDMPVADLAAAEQWLSAASRRAIRDCRRPMSDGRTAFPPQVGGGYEAFWLRDYCYMLEYSEAFSERELRDAAQLFVGALRDDGAGVDCVRFDGTPIYKPGYGTMGENPVADGSLFTVDVVWRTHQRLQDREFLLPLIAPLERAMTAVPRNPQSGLVCIAPAGYDRCPYGFTDSVHKQGDVLFCSLLLVQADREMSDLLKAVDRPRDAATFDADAKRVADAVRKTFWDDSLGLFRAATVKCGQPDLWGSAFAVVLGVADEKQSARIAGYFREHYAEIVERGQLRHLPAGLYWDEACQRDTYQNGGYWATPVGWFVEVLARVDRPLAEQTIVDLVQDFRARGVREWVCGERSAVPDYLASLTLPLAGARRLMATRDKQ